jgi:microcystin degradation protein MlrC
MEPIAREMIWVTTEGITTADLATFTYRHRRVPLYPLEADAAFPPARASVAVMKPATL